MIIGERFRINNLNRPTWWGRSTHTAFTVVVFVILASLDNAAIGIVPPLIKVISKDLAVSEGSMGIVTAMSIAQIVDMNMKYVSSNGSNLEQNFLF